MKFVPKIYREIISSGIHRMKWQRWSIWRRFIWTLEVGWYSVLVLIALTLGWRET